MELVTGAVESHWATPQAMSEPVFDSKRVLLIYSFPHILCLFSGGNNDYGNPHRLPVERAYSVKLRRGPVASMSVRPSYLDFLLFVSVFCPVRIRNIVEMACNG
jgi:hypothetical protein